MSIQANARSLPPGTTSETPGPEKVEGKVRVVERVPGSNITFEREVDRDSVAGIAALSGASERWRLIPEGVNCVNPGGRLVRLRPDIHAHELELAKKNKLGWRMARESEESVPAPEPEPPSPTRWARHPNGRIVRIVLGSHDAELCDRSMHGWRWASDAEVEKRLALGASFNVVLGGKEY